MPRKAIQTQKDARFAEQTEKLTATGAVEAASAAADPDNNSMWFAVPADAKQPFLSSLKVTDLFIVQTATEITSKDT